MPQQGPGTKLVLKGLARVFPEIAEQRAREEQEERDRLLGSKRKQTSRRDDRDDRQGQSGRSRRGSSIHSHAAEDFEPGENYRPESVQRGPSMHTNSRDPGYYSESRGHSRGESIGREISAYGNSRDSRGQSQSRGHSRVEKDGRELSTYSNSRDPGGQIQSRGNSRAESIRRAYSNHSNASHRSSTRRSTRDRGASLTMIEEDPMRRV